MANPVPSAKAYGVRVKPIWFLNIFLNFTLAKCFPLVSLVPMDEEFIHIPHSARAAGAELRRGFQSPPAALPDRDFIRTWSSIAYLFPGLHPDGFADGEGGWPRVLQPFAEEAWRRAELGILTDAHLYPSDAQWAGIYDQLRMPTLVEGIRRLDLSVMSDQFSHG